MMLKKFEVTNFKNFQETLSFDLSTTKNYEFNPECVRNGIVKTGLIYGVNGSGKSNLGRAVVDVMSNFSDESKVKIPFYLNADSVENIAKFKAIFQFEGVEIIYICEKDYEQKIISERLVIDAEVMVEYELGKPFFTALKGSENLNKIIDIYLNLSAVKYIYKNTILEDNFKNNIFKKFINFCADSFFMKGVSSNGSKDSHALQNIIVKNKETKNLEDFLNKCGIDCQLSEIEVSDQKIIGFIFKEKIVPFDLAASTGTKFILTIYLMIRSLRQGDIPFLFVDEFDAHFHFDLANAIVEQFKNTNAQVILTTHNTNLLSNYLIRPDCAFVLDGKTIQPLHALTNKDLRAAHSLEKMYRAGAFHHD